MKKFCLILLLVFGWTGGLLCCSSRSERPKPSPRVNLELVQEKVELSFQPSFGSGYFNCSFLDKVSVVFPSLKDSLPPGKEPEGKFLVNKKEIEFHKADSYQCAQKTCRAVLKNVSLKPGYNFISVRIYYPELGKVKKGQGITTPEIAETTLAEIGEHPEEFTDKLVCLKGLAKGWVEVHLTEAQKKFTEQKTLAKDNWAKSRSDGSFYDRSAWAYYPGFIKGAEWQEICARIVLVQAPDSSKNLWRLEPTCSRKISPLSGQ